MKLGLGFLSLILIIAGTSFAESASPLSHFDHEFHSDRVFSQRKIFCEQCHNFRLNTETNKIVPTQDLHKSAFKKEFKDICHSCHVQEAAAMGAPSPKACYSCHQGTDAMKTIKPQNHNNVGWARSHSMEARVDGSSCQECHTNSECVHCHLRRNDIEMKNHTRNFRYTHSIEARAQPQSCDSCHAKHFCIDCHLGEK